MTAFVVMDATGNQSGLKTVFVRDRFAILGFVAPVLWLAWHRLWLEAICALAAAIGLAALGTLVGFQNAAPLLSILVSIYVAIEGSQLRIWALERRGFTQVATVEADNENEAELRYFSATSSRDADPAKAVNAQPAGVTFGRPVKSQTGPALGMLDYPGAR